MTGRRRDIWNDGTVWPIGIENIKVIADVGYAAVDIPESLKYCVWRLVDSIYALRRQNPSLQSFTFNRVSGTLRTEAEQSEDYRRIVRKYARRLVVPT